MITLDERVKRYLDKTPPAVSGANGHGQTFALACVLWNGFALSEAEVEHYLRDYSTRCDPPWSDGEIKHKVAEAAKAKHDKPRGHLLGDHPRGSSVAPRPTAPQETPRKFKLKKKVGDTQEALPHPIEDAARVLLQLAFEPGEHVRLVVGQYDETGAKDRPVDSGVILPIEDWLDKLEKKGGDPNGIFRVGRGKQPGIFIGMNPVKAKGKRDSDVTAFRHALIEFDEIPLEEQWAIIRESNIPCACVIASGGKSVHAWVRIDAKDRREFDERVKVLHEAFGEYGLDTKNRNPARLSRLPGCKRGDKRQELLATKIGAESFVAWQAAQVTESSGGAVYSIKELLDHDTKDDPACLLGRNYLKRGGSLLVIGQSGIGKSSWLMQAACSWALGKPFFGIEPRKPLRQLIVQAENDKGDLAEMVQGVLAGMKIDELTEALDRIDEMVIPTTDLVHVGDAFIKELERRIAEHRPDLVWIDPLLSFIGDDISRQDVCSRFLRQGLQPLIHHDPDAGKEGVGVIVMHHTNKPPQEKGKSNWSRLDAAYSGAGSAELVNWFRGVCTITEAEVPGFFRLTLSKRGDKAGAKDLDGEEQRELWMKHSKVGINWLPSRGPISPAKPAAAAAGDRTPRSGKRAAGAKREAGRPLKFDYDRDAQAFAQEVDGFQGVHAGLRSKFRARFKCSGSTFDRAWRDGLNELLDRNESTGVWHYVAPKK